MTLDVGVEHHPSSDAIEAERRREHVDGVDAGHRGWEAIRQPFGVKERERIGAERLERKRERARAKCIGELGGSSFVERKRALVPAKSGSLGVRRIVSEAWMKEATQPKAAHLLPANQGGVGYQYQWWVPRVSADGSDDGAFMAIGVWGQFMYVQPRDRLVIVKTSVDPRPDDVEHAQVFAAIAQALRAP